MELLQPSSLAELGGGLAIHGGTEVVPLLRDGILQAETLVDIRSVVPAGGGGKGIGAGTTAGAPHCLITAGEHPTGGWKCASRPKFASAGGVSSF